MERVKEIRETLDELVKHFDSHKEIYKYGGYEFERRFNELIGLVDIKVNLLKKILLRK